MFTGATAFLIFLVSKFKRQSKADTMKSEIYYPKHLDFVIRQNIRPAVYDPAVLLNYSGVFNPFTPIYLSFLNGVENPLNPTGLPLDVILFTLRFDKAYAMHSKIYYPIKYVFLIRQNIQPAVYDPAVLLNYPCAFRPFTTIYTAFLSDIVNQLKPTGLPSDVISPLLLKQVLDVVDPTLLNWITMGIEPGDNPNSLNHVRLKRLNLDPSVLLNFRSSYNLLFSSKIPEKLVFHQSLLFESKILNTKLDFRKSHSTETAYLKCSNDVLLTTDSVALASLDLSAAFDMVDHNLLSYPSDSSFSGNITPFHSGSVSLTCGIPQGSAPAPILFPLNMIQLHYYISNHYYVDGNQIYLNFKQILAMVPSFKYIKTYIPLNNLSLNKRGELMHYDAQHIPNVNSIFSTLRDNSLKARRQLDQALKFNNSPFKPTLNLQNNNFPKARPQTPVPKFLRGPLVRKRFGLGLTGLTTAFLFMKKNVRSNII